MGMKMPQVKQCTVAGCAYNTSMACHAMAITVGEPAGDPTCDTFFEATRHGGVRDMTAGVGACKSYDCKHNKDYECMAPDIMMGMKQNQPDCLTYETR